MKRPGIVLWAPIALIAATGRAQESDECLACHDDPSLEGTRSGKTVSMYVSGQRFSGSVHADVTCVGCHADLAGTEFPHTEDPAPVDCGLCHSPEQEQHTGSLHGKALQRNDPLAPTCVTCHGKHNIVHVNDPSSPVRVLEVPSLCGTCHKEGTEVMKFRTVHQDSILENYSESLHGEGLLRKGLIVAPNCTSCHTAHNIRKHTDPASSIARVNIAATCSKCHAEIETVHRKVIRGELWEKEAHVLPACVDCHQPHKIRKVYYTQGMSDRDCLGCHGREGITASSDGRSLFVDSDELSHSRHAKIACNQCHSEVTTSRIRACETITKKVECASCHAEIGTTYAGSVHGTLFAANDANAPTCKECHGTHGVLGRGDPGSPIFPTNIPALCAKCHRQGEKAAVRYVGPETEVVEHYTESIHGKGLMESGLTVTATCSNCHTAHDVRPRTDPRSSVNRNNVPATCGQCHHGIEEQFRGSIHFTMVGKSDQPPPVCIDCHSAHTIRRTDSEGFRLEIMDQCGRCHESIARTYFDTYHGKVAQLGYTKTAKCYDCHGAHDILPVSDPASRLSRENVVKTCQKCHEGATRRFAGYLTHATHHDPQKYPFLFYTFWGMTGLLIVTFVFGGVHTVMWLPRALQMRRELRRLPPKQIEGKNDGEEREGG